MCSQGWVFRLPFSRRGYLDMPSTCEVDIWLLVVSLLWLFSYRNFFVCLDMLGYQVVFSRPCGYGVSNPPCVMFTQETQMGAVQNGVIFVRQMRGRQRRNHMVLGGFPLMIRLYPGWVFVWGRRKNYTSKRRVGLRWIAPKPLLSRLISCWG